MRDKSFGEKISKTDSEFRKFEVKTRVSYMAAILLNKKMAEQAKAY